MAAGDTNWKLSLGATARYDNIQKILTSLAQSGKSSKATAQKDAFLAETEAYEAATTREEYDAACRTLAAPEGSHIIVSLPESGVIHTLQSPKSADEGGITIGKFAGCHHIASGITSSVYRTGQTALKVITESHNIEPHNPALEVKLLKLLSDRPDIITLISTFNDSHSHLVLEMLYMPYTLQSVLSSATPITSTTTHTIFTGLFKALAYLHSQGIIHRDIKPSNILLSTAAPAPSAPCPIQLCDFGTAWHPTLSLPTEPSHHKVLEVGTTHYRAPETLFGNRSYDTSLDIWSTGCLLVECLRQPLPPISQAPSDPSTPSNTISNTNQPIPHPAPLFTSRNTDEDGNQLGLILSMFKTLGTPTRETWPEATAWKTNPFDFWNIFEGLSWDVLLKGCEEWGKVLVEKCVVFESGKRITADEAVRYLEEHGA